MKTGFNKEPWKGLLPEVFGWADKVEITKITEIVPGAHHVVAVANGSDEEKESIEIDAPALSDTIRKKISDHAKALGWKGGSGSIAMVVDGVAYLAVVQTKIKTTLPQRARQFGQDAAKAIKDCKVDHIVLCKTKELCTMKMIEGLAQGLHATVGFKGKKEGADAKAPLKTTGKLPAKLGLLGSTATDEEIRQAREMSKAVAFSRMMQDAPANWMDPIRFGEIAADISKDAGVKCSVLNKEQITALGMGSFISVSNGSDIEPRLITIEIDGVDNTKTVSLVGKGLTFDAGGVSIKPSAGMEEMKYDMSGGAAVLASAMYLSKVKPPVKVVCIIGATENLINGKATKPGDVFVAMNGKTIEVQNTDAEGRLVLADLLHYAATKYNPDMIIDIATLTGAVLMALGTAGAGLMGNDQATSEYVLRTSQAIGEPIWQLPLWPELEKETKGSIADLNNIAKPNVKAGTIMGAMFLKEFVGDRKWVHLDIAGTGWNTKATGYPESGGSAFGLRTMVEACMRFNK